MLCHLRQVCNCRRHTDPGNANPRGQTARRASPADFAEVGAPIERIGERPSTEILVQLVLEKESDCRSSCLVQSFDFFVADWTCAQRLHRLGRQSLVRFGRRAAG